MNAEGEPLPGSKHLQLLLGSLAEYAAKLKITCDEWTNLKWRLALTVLVLLFGLGLTALGWIALDSVGLDYRERRLMTAATTMLMTISLFGALYFAISLNRRKRLKRHDIAILAEQVGRLIRLASQFEERGKVEDFSEKMLLDLRLAEAEASLRYSKVIDRDSLLNFIMPRSGDFPRPYR